MKTRTQLAILLAGIVGIASFLFVSLSSEPGKRGLTVGTRSAQAACTSGSDCLPQLTYIDTTGRVHKPGDLVGKVVVINFWATWCKPCQTEIPAFSKVAAKYQDRVVMLGVLVDNPDPQALLDFTTERAMTYPVVRQDPDIRRAYGDVEGLPMTLVFDGQGNRLTRHLGAMSEQKLTAAIELGIAAR
jgi:thiol-disulfide isomerase/thioredoxin